MTIMLAAATMMRDTIKAQDIQTLLQKSSSIKIDKEWLRSDKRELNLMQHMLTLFDLARIKNDKTFTQIMTNMAIALESGL